MTTERIQSMTLQANAIAEIMVHTMTFLGPRMHYGATRQHLYSSPRAMYLREASLPSQIEIA